LNRSGPEPRERLRLPGARAPKPLLDPEIERRLTSRQRELLDALEELVVSGDLGGLTMAEIAARMNCSLRTLYGIAESKEELFLAVVDRRLHRIGRRAIASLDASLPPLDALRAYMRAVSEAIDPERSAFSREFADLPGGQRMLDAHERYVTAVIQSLLDRAVSEGQIAPCDTASVAHVLAGLGREFAQPAAAEAAKASPKATVESIADIILRGLVARSAAGARGRSPRPRRGARA
jgi:AcrR family transcriptional regulator